MKFLRSSKAHLVIFFLLANLLILASNVPSIIRYLNTPAGFKFNFNHILWVHDYSLYLSAITQGKHGAWFYTDSFTTEPTKPGIFYIFYIWLGKIALIFNLSSPVAYLLTRIISLEIFVILIYLLAQTLLGKSGAFWAALLSLIGTISPLIFFKESLPFDMAIPWWTNFDALERLNTLPHYTFAHVLLLISLICTIKYIRKPNIKYALLAGISIFIGGIIFPAVLAPFGFALPLAIFFHLLITFIIKKKIIINPRLLSGLVLIFLFAVASYLIIHWQEQQGYPWNIWTSWNVGRWNRQEPWFNLDLMFLFGILPLLALPTIVNIVRSDQLDYLFIVSWVVLPFILLPYVDILNIPKLRLLDDAHFIPFAFLASITISKIINRFKKSVQIIILILILFTMIPVSIQVFQWKIDFVSQNLFPGSFFYPKKDLAAFKFIEQNIPKYSVFLTENGNTIPSFAPVISFYGHLNLTSDFTQKEAIGRLFFSGKMTQEEAQEFLSKNHINYIYISTAERKLNPQPLSYSFLNPIYQTDGVTIFKVDL